MIFKGGTVLFDTKIKNVKEIILEILQHNDTTSEFLHKNNPGQGVTYIFKINFNSEIFSKYFFKIDKNIQAPKVLIIKLLAHNFISSILLLGMPGRNNTAKLRPITIRESQFQNEIIINKTLGSQSNIVPLCPSLLYHERINNGGGESSLTTLGKAFYNLIKKDKTQFDSFETYLLDTLRTQDKSIPMRDSTLEIKDYALYNVIQEMIIMEYVDCKTLFQIYHVNSKNSTEEKQLKNGVKFLYNTKINLPKIHTEEVFYLLYLATLLALEGYSHGDLHTNNVLVCSELQEKTDKIYEAKINVNPILIDFGKAEKIEDLQFRVLLLGVTPITREKKLWEKNKVPAKFIDIYYEAINHSNNIAQFINEKLENGEFVYAIIVISMCISKTTSIKEPSMFMYAFFKNDYNTVYATFYSMFDEIIVMDEKTRDYNKIVIDYDAKIKQFIELRKQLIESKKQLMHLQEVDDDKLVLERQTSSIRPTFSMTHATGIKKQYQKKTRRRRRRQSRRQRTLYKNKSRKAKKN
jgi:serine/threonine protein kinase